MERVAVSSSSAALNISAREVLTKHSIIEVRKCPNSFIGNERRDFNVNAQHFKQ